MKREVLVFTILFFFLTPVILAFSEERYIVEVKGGQISKSISDNIVDEIDSGINRNQIAKARIGLSKKKIVVENISREILELEDSIVRLEPDYKVYSLDDITPWNYEAIGINFSDMGDNFGQGVKIAVLDTGADFGLLNVEQGFDFVNEDSDASDDNGHGTLVTQILRNPFGNTPLTGSEVYVVKVLDQDGSGFVSDVIEGINWAVDNDIDIVLMSLGGEQDSSFLEEAIQGAYSQGILVIAAAGNENSIDLTYPAKYNEVIGVGSVNPNLDKSSFSNYGNDLELVAPGENIIVFDGSNYLEFQGTSFSVPHVGIVAAGHWSDDLSLTNLEIRNKLRNTAIDLGVPGRDDLFGWGLVKYLQDEQNNNSDENLSLDTNSISKVFWSYGNVFANEAINGELIKMNLETINELDGQNITFKIYEEDNFPNPDDLVASGQTTLFNNKASMNWQVVYAKEISPFNADYYFEVQIGNTNKKQKSATIPFRLNRGNFDCEPEANQQCASSLKGINLICDGNTPILDIQDEGCCFVHENWNTIINSCSDAIKGKIYQVTQNGQTFNEATYGNLKLRVFVAEDDFALNSDNIVKSFDLFSSSQGDFAFNPEREVSSWNWDAGFLAKYYVHSIYVIEGNEVIGKWTNQFSDDPKYQNAIESVNQIVRIHKDKTTWRKVPEFPEVDPFAGLSLSTQSLNEQSLNIQKPVHLNWNGKLNISETGEYIFLFNVTGNVKLRINGKEIINSERDGIKEGKIILDSLENNVTFEFFESGNHNPKIYWQYEDKEIKEITEENLIRESTKTILIDELDKLSSLSFSEVNNQPDYMISFLEKPETLRNQNPLILVHGKHGESGYWDEGDAQNWFNNLSNGGYDSWEFYYPGDDYINVSGALLGDALDYLKKHDYNQNQKFDIVTHSMGGLVARSYVQNISSYTYKNDVNHLVMIGAPNYGAAASNAIFSNWTLILPLVDLNTPIPYWAVEEIRLNGLNWLISNLITQSWQKDISNSPIYKQMSLGSTLGESLNQKIIPLDIRTLIIIGDRDDTDLSDILNPESFLCSLLDQAGHQEGKNNEHDCLVAIASSSLLDKNVSLTILPDKNHATEKDEIQDFAPLIKSFLNDSTDSVLASRSFSYYNPNNPSSKKNFNYQEGSIQIKLLEEGQIWNQFDNANLEIQRISTGQKFKMTRNMESKNYFHFNRQDGEDDSYYTIPSGQYKLIVPGQNDRPELHFEVKPMETNFLTVNLIEEICNPNWQCSEWSSCVGNQKNRNCVDLNSCGSLDSKPFESEFCQEEGIMKINFPSDGILSDRRFPINITLTDTADKIVYIDNSDSRPREKALCRRGCLGYGDDRARTLSLSDGWHNLTFKAIKNNISLDEENVSLMIDSRTPKIFSTLPKSNSFTNGSNFYIKYTEDNCQSLGISLYGNASGSGGVSSCQSGVSIEKFINQGLDSYNNQSIEYQFIIKDIANNTKESRKTKIKVDTTEPVINSFVNITNGRRVTFTLNITELNFDEVSYIDQNDTPSIIRMLCSSLKNGEICSSTKTFRAGEHNVTITVLDKAGNSIQKNTIFSV